MHAGADPPPFFFVTQTYSFTRQIGTVIALAVSIAALTLVYVWRSVRRWFFDTLLPVVVFAAAGAAVVAMQATSARVCERFAPLRRDVFSLIYAPAFFRACRSFFS